uniref:Uncharacterized protein n=1 Tax=Zea mays TaxID=4577 RepID=A0A804NEF9_MAIZE
MHVYMHLPMEVNRVNNSGNPTVGLHAGVRREAGVVERRSAGSRRRRRRPQDGFHEVHHRSQSRLGHETAGALGFKEHREAGAFRLHRRRHDIGSCLVVALPRAAAAVLRLRRVAGVRRRAALLDELPLDGGGVLESGRAAGEEERLGAEVRRPRRRGVDVRHGRRRLRRRHAHCLRRRC